MYVDSATTLFMFWLFMYLRELELVKFNFMSIKNGSYDFFRRITHCKSLLWNSMRINCPLKVHGNSLFIIRSSSIPHENVLYNICFLSQTIQEISCICGFWWHGFIGQSILKSSFSHSLIASDGYSVLLILSLILR